MLKKEDLKTSDLEFKDKNRNQETRIIVNYAKHMLPVVITTKKKRSSLCKFPLQTYPSHTEAKKKFLVHIRLVLYC